MRFTQAACETLTIPKGKTDHIEWDESMPGFGIRFQNGGGNPSYTIKFRVGTKQRLKSLGRVSQVKLTAAKAMASKLFGEAVQNIDPVKKAALARIDSKNTITALKQDFLDWLTSNGRSQSWIDFNDFALTTHWEPLHKYSLGEITRALVADQLKSLTKTSGPTSADQCRAVLSKFFNWAMGEGKAENNPVHGTNKNGTAKRTRVLTFAEIKKIWHALPNDDYGKICQLLILNGSRLAEMGDLSRSETDLGNRQIILLPGDRTKNGLPHTIPLAPHSLALLRGMTKTGRDFFFGKPRSTNPTKKPKKAKGYSGWTKSKKRLDEILKFKKAWTHHDFRRSLATYMRQECKVLPHIVEAVLNHVSGADKGGVAGVYNYAEYDEEKRAALISYEEFILRVVNS